MSQPRAKDRVCAVTDYDDFLKSLGGIAERMRDISRRAVKQYAPIVEDIIRSRSRDIRFIENTLDGILDFCGYKPAIRLYRRLCRYYMDIDPAATADYVRAYREMWDSDAGPVTEPSGQRKSPAARSVRSGSG